MPYANIEAVLTEDQMENIRMAVQGIRNELPFLVNLTPREKNDMGRWRNDYLAFLKSAQEYAHKNPQLISESFDMEGWDKDIALHDQLMLIRMQLGQLLAAVEDTYTAVRYESQQKAGMFRNIAIQAAKTNYPGADSMVNDLNEKLHARRKKK